MSPRSDWALLCRSILRGMGKYRALEIAQQIEAEQFLAAKQELVELMDDDGEWAPLPHEIEAACAEIQREWDPEMLLLRRHPGAFDAFIEARRETDRNYRHRTREKILARRRRPEVRERYLARQRAYFKENGASIRARWADKRREWSRAQKARDYVKLQEGLAAGDPAAIAQVERRRQRQREYEGRNRDRINAAKRARRAAATQTAAC